jgi:competence protein ComEC
MKIWQRYPFVRLFLPFIIGILLSFELNIDNKTGLWLLAACIPFILFLHYFQLRTLSYYHRLIPGLGVTFTALLFGAGITGYHNHRSDILHFINNGATKGTFIITIEDVPINKPSTIRLIVRVNSRIINGILQKCDGKAMVYFQRSDEAKKLRYGDQLIVTTSFKPMAPPMNPGVFNYSAYLSHQGVYSTTYIADSQWKLFKKASGFNLIRLATELREKFIKLFAAQHPGQSELAVASALVLGYDDNIEPELRTAYQNSGALHILSVGGLHLGVIYLVIANMLFFMKQKVWSDFLRAFILLSVVWFYALITGLCPAVLRSAVLISFVIVGDCVNREQNIVNTLAASAFLLLVIDPHQLANVGFQLSYLSVAGIVIFEPVIRKTWSPKFLVSRWIWSLTTVSIAAQLAATPVSLFYFYQFPNYFIFSNYIAIPLSSLAIYAGMLTLVTTPVIWLTHQFADLFFGSVWFLNQSILFFSNLPFSTLKNISLSVFEVIALYGILLSGFGAIVYRNKKLLTLFIASCLIAGLSFLFEQQIHRKQQTLIVYAIAKTSAIDFFNGQTCYSFSAPANKKDSAQIQYQVNVNRIRSGIGRIIQSNLYSDSAYLTKGRNKREDGFWKNDSFYLFGNLRLTVQQGKWISGPIPLIPLTTDYLLLTGNPYPDLSQALKRYHFRHLIVDGSNSITNALKWQQLCRDAGILCHNTAIDGAFILNMKD